MDVARLKVTAYQQFIFPNTFFGNLSWLSWEDLCEISQRLMGGRICCITVKFWKNYLTLQIS